MKPFASLAALFRAAPRGLSSLPLGALCAWLALSGCSSSGNDAATGACSGDACPAQTPPCAKDADCAAAQFCKEGVCRKDVCSQGVVDCDPASGGLRVCADNGSRSDVAACPASTACVAGDSGAACQPWVCSPGQASCTSDGKTKRTCADDGLSFSDQSDCAKGTSCIAGACETITCSPNQLLCKNGSSYVCSADGTSAMLQQTCDSISFCDDESGRCLTKPCTPGTKTCLDQAIGTCNADGTGYDRTECALNEVCSSGACAPAVCAPNEVYCDSTQVAKQCNASGTAATPLTTCVAGTHCISVTNTYATCGTSSCTPGADMCDGTRATVCEADGSGPAAGGTDCAQVGGTCSAGQCKTQVCTANQRFCVNNSVYLCSSDGSSAAPATVCASGCNPNTANCAVPSCTPNALSCSGTSVLQCDATGFSTSVVQNCSTSNQACVAGRCEPTVCTPYAQTCKNGNVYICSPDGTGDAVYTICGNGTYCSSGFCAADVCSPGAPVCNGNALSTCKADGSGPTDAGTACASGTVCDKGACAPTVCTPSTAFCSNGDVRLCNAQGDGSTLYQHCFSDTYCSSGACLADVCPNGAPYCSGETLLSCKADGSGPTDAGTDCSTSGKICSATGCATSIVDTIGTGGNGSNFVTAVGEIIHTQKARKLTRVELDSFGDSIIKNTIVYSSTDGVNFYLLANVPGSSSVDFPGGFNDSGPLDVELQANTYYFIGENLLYGEIYYNDSGITPAPLSFATVLKSVFQNLAFSVPSSFVPTQSTLTVHERLTTALP